VIFMKRVFRCFLIPAAICGVLLASAPARGGEGEAADAYLRRIKTLAGHVADGTMETRRTTAALLRTMGKPVLQYLESELKAPEPDRRARAALVLGEIGSPSVHPPLRGALKDPEGSVRAQAVAAIGKLGTKESAAEIAPLLDDRDEAVRAEAARVLGELQAARYAPKIERLLFDPSEKVRINALAAAGNLRDMAAVPAAARALDSPSAAVRNNAVIALGKIGDRSSLPQIRKALGDADQWVRSSAAVALGEMRDGEAVPLIEKTAGDESACVRGAAASALGDFKAERSIPSLCALLSDPRPSGFALLSPYRRTEVRDEAAEALGKITGDTRGFSKAADPAAREEALQRWRDWCEARAKTPTPKSSPPNSGTNPSPP
jgi:HEAT repeat protein